MILKWALKHRRRAAEAGLRGIFRNSDGAAAIEWAVMGSVAITFTILFIELTMMFFVNIMVEGALRDAARFGLTGYIPTGVTREAYILQLVKDGTMGFLDKPTTKITYKIYEAFDQVGQGEPFVDGNGNGKFDEGETYTDVNGNGQYDDDLGIAGAGNGSDIVAYKIEYIWDVITPIAAPFVGNNGTLTFTASIVVQNEPF